MEIVHAIRPDGSTVQLRADGTEVGTTDSDQKLLHLLPKLLLDDPLTEAVSLDRVVLEVISDVDGLLPAEGVVIRQPYPNSSYLVGGSVRNRNGWCAPAANLPERFEVEFRWTFVSLLSDGSDWVVRHFIQLELEQGPFRTYTMAVSNWPNGRASVPNMYRYATAFLKPSQVLEQHRKGRPTLNVGVLRDGMLGVTFREEMRIPPIPYEQATSIHLYQKQQLHEVVQLTDFSLLNDEHKANGALEMPARVLLDAISLAAKVPYKRPEVPSATPGSSEDCLGQLESHPALQLLSDWWNAHRIPVAGELPAAMVMPYIRVQDDNSYWSGYREMPNSTIEGMNCVSSSCATCGDAVLLHFMASVKHSEFPDGFLDVRCLDGSEWVEVEATREQMAKGEYDEAYYCLAALAGFPNNFPAAYRRLLQDSFEAPLSQPCDCA
ncbi:hypothetical protein QMA79_19290 [Pseudomonas aeruginosa]|uniref:hypothetical protein n=1 Tax=Pseudomonas aeruginosa TaxID=287 RepID=UPI0024AD8591|nr:hypothetical protein [Pseudomonas aeruginosa]MDI6671961.1 hypothetical protein [Pseudomonas aeruginosa]